MRSPRPLVEATSVLDPDELRSLGYLAGAVPEDATFDHVGAPRLADVLAVTDTGVGPAPVVDMGAFEVPSAWLQLPDKGALNHDARFDAVRLLDRFKPTDAAILRLRHAEGWRIHEIAEHLGSSQRTVRRRLERIEQRARVLVHFKEAA